MLRYAITDAALPEEDPAHLRERRLADLRRWTADGVQMVQLREKKLSAGALVALAEVLVEELRAAERQHPHLRRPLLLVNGRADIAAAAGADGLHLSAHPDELTPDQAREVFAHAGRTRAVVAVSCHTFAEVERARRAAADFIAFGPVFEKRVEGAVVQPGSGLERLAEACAAAGPVPVLALGGVTAQNATLCLSAGAGGIAGIRLFAS